MLPRSISFVDVETSGTSARFSRIIEIGIIRVEDNRVVREFSSLINPQAYVDPVIESLTGITLHELENAPTFYEIKDDIKSLLAGSVFVAHNVRFDYGFLRNEFKRYGDTFSSKHFCSVKLARKLYPGFRSYNLDSIIERFQILCEKRHRALDDAKVIWEFYKKSLLSFGQEKIEGAIDFVVRRPSIPLALKQRDLENLPESPGIYIFYAGDGAPLYIGKSINIKERVLSHFSNDYLSPVDMKISQQVASIETMQTAGELGALLLEARLIKSMQPLLNRKLRYARKMIVLLKSKNEEGFHCVVEKDAEMITKEDVENILGVFRSIKQLRDFLFSLAKEYALCPKLLHLEKTSGYCFYYHLGICKGACSKKERILQYNLRFDEAFYTHKVKPWYFDKPIIVKEEGEKMEGHVIDKWCYLGSLQSESERLEDMKREYTFDYDTYKILSKYILDPKNQKNIKTFTFID